MPFDPNDPTAHLVDARAHTALSPRVQASVAVAKGLEIRAAVARQVQAPDPDLLFQGKNTDLALTNRSQLFGRDLDFTKSTIAELGVRQTVSRNIELNVAGYDASRPSEIVSRIVQLPDPAQNGEIGDFFSDADTTNGWVQVNGSAVMPERTVKLRLQIRFPKLNGTVAFDDFTLSVRPLQ